MAIKMFIEVLGDVAFKDEEVPWETGMNVQKALENLYQRHAEDKAKPIVEFKLEYFGAEHGQTLGYELDTLDALSSQVSGDGRNFMFWELRVNGAETNTGIDSTHPKDGDKIELRYTAFSEKHTGTRYEALRDVLQARKG